jgi:xylulokinase
LAALRDEYVLAIDLGTSGPKVALYSTKGDPVAYEFAPTPVHLLPNGGAEQNPEDWWNAMQWGVQKLLAQGLAPVEQIVALCLTTQWSGTVAVDRDGKPLMNAIIWMDSRGAPYVKKICGGGIEFEGYNLLKLLRWLRLTGGAPAHSGKDSLAHILYIKHELPQVYKQTYKFLEPKDYLNLRLTGRYAAGHDSIMLHWVTDTRTISNIAYDKQLLALSTLDRDKLPDLGRAVDVLGPLNPEVAREWGLSEKVQVVMGTPDVFSAAVGSGAVRDYEAHLYVGTSSWVGCHVPFKKTDLFHNMASLPAAIPDRYFFFGTQESAGIGLNFVRDNILYHEDELPSAPQPDDIYQIFDRIAEQTPAGSGGLIFTPWLYGERAPVEDHTVRSGFFNQSLQTTRAHLIRAVFEGVALNARWLLAPIESSVGHRLDTINMVGGGAKSDIWCQIHADVLNRTIRQIQDPILVNARGAAFLAAVALGGLTFDEIPNRVQIAHTYTPNPENRALYDELFHEFVNIYNRNKKIYARLNRKR